MKRYTSLHIISVVTVVSLSVFLAAGQAYAQRVIASVGDPCNSNKRGEEASPYIPGTLQEMWVKKLVCVPTSARQPTYPKGKGLSLTYSQETPEATIG
jgi:hypothetical protein